MLGPDQIPVIVDDERAQQAPELAVLSAMAHARGDPLVAARITRAMRRACAHLEPERAAVYYDIVERLLTQAARTALEEMMELRDYKFKSAFSRKHIAIGRAEGKAEGKAEAVLAVLNRRGVAVSDQERQRILTCTDLAVLERWLDTAVTANDVREVFERH